MVFSACRSISAVDTDAFLKPAAPLFSDKNATPTCRMSACRSISAVDLDAFLQPAPPLFSGKNTIPMYGMLTHVSCRLLDDNASKTSTVSASTWHSRDRRDDETDCDSSLLRTSADRYRDTMFPDILFTPDIVLPPICAGNLDIIEEDEEEGSNSIIAMLGEYFRTNRSTKKVPVEQALQQSEIIVIIYGRLDQQELQKLKYFSSGYDQSISFVYVPPSDLFSVGQLSVFKWEAPLSWYAIDDASNSSELEKELNLHETEGQLVIIDAKSQEILCRDALEQIVQLDTSDELYDSKALRLVHGWIKGLGLKQKSVGKMVVFP